MSEVKFKLSAGTNVGLIRTNNEDNFVVCPDLSTSKWLIPQDGNYAVLGELGALLVVADGMGGANAGEVASAIAVQTIQQLFVPTNIRSIVGDDKAMQQFMKDVVKSADLNILNQSKQDASAKGMGTTVVMAWILDRRAYVCWCGDSRCYSFNTNRGLLQISKDHSYVQELVDQGELDPEFMHDHPLSNVITRCLGDMEKRANPDTRVYELNDGDSIMLCSDGLSGLCYDDQIAEIIGELFDRPMDCKNELISAALNNGGHDNVTVAMITVRTEEDARQALAQNSQEVKKVNEEERSLKDTVPSFGSSKTKKKLAERNKKHPIQEKPATIAPVKEDTIVEKLIVEEMPDVETSATKEPVKAEPVQENSVEKPTAGADNSSQEEKTTEHATAQEDSKDNESTEKKENDSSKEDPQATAKPNPPGKKSKKAWKLVLLLTIVLFFIAACCIYFIPECAPFKDAILQALEGISGKKQ